MKEIWSVSTTPASVASPSSAAAPTAWPPVRPTARYRLEIVTPSGSLCSRIATNTMTPSAGRTRNALAIATPSKKVCSSSPTRAEGPARRFTACVSSPKWKCGVSVCCVRCTARYPARTSAGAALPERANASGSTSTSATASMKPAPNATKCSISASSRAARRVTASAPTTLPSAATRAYQKALDTGEEVIARVTGRILEHFRQQPLERLAHLRPGAHPGGQEIVALYRQVLHRQRILRRPNGRHDFREVGDGMRDAGCGLRREEGEQV